MADGDNAAHSIPLDSPTLPPRKREQEMSWPCRAVLSVVFAVIAMPVAAQKPTMEQLESMLEARTRIIPERPGFELPFYRWNDGAPIAPYIVTDGQTSPCVEIAREATQRQIDWMRRDVNIATLSWSVPFRKTKSLLQFLLGWRRKMPPSRQRWRTGQRRSLST